VDSVQVNVLSVKLSPHRQVLNAQEMISARALWNVGKNSLRLLMSVEGTKNYHGENPMFFGTSSLSLNFNFWVLHRGATCTISTPRICASSGVIGYSRMRNSPSAFSAHASILDSREIEMRSIGVRFLF
jgi:hypothetical protein